MGGMGGGSTPSLGSATGGAGGGGYSGVIGNSSAGGGLADLFGSGLY
jgi:hypothetical protein